MGYDIQLVDKDGEPVTVERFFGGGTRPFGGSTVADIGVTYNYAIYFYNQIDKELGIRWLYGKTGEECVPRLHAAVRALGTFQADDYWDQTPGNAGHILELLLRWAKQNPTACFQGD